MLWRSAALDGVNYTPESDINDCDAIMVNIDASPPFRVPMGRRIGGYPDAVKKPSRRPEEGSYLSEFSIS